MIKILFISLGCDKNLVDSENMLGLLSKKGYEMTDDEEDADVIIINTCCFIHDAKEESVQTILEMAGHRRNGKCRALIVTGCMAQRYRSEIPEEIKEVDAVLGTASYDEIAKTVELVLNGQKYEHYQDIDRLPLPEADRVVTTGGHYAYLKIAEGCDKHCTYCIIPKIRGSFRSVPMERLISEAEKLAQQGVKELILVAQETTLYGKDLYGEKRLHVLLHELAGIQGIRWIRILYCYPEEIYDELIETMRREKKVCHYLDLPIQHASDRILRKMGRRTTRADLEAIIGKLRERIPDITLRTTLITGFPGETQEDHEQLMDFIDQMEFERLGVFTYSQEEDTPAAVMEGQIEEEIKEARRDELMQLQQEIAFEKNESMCGRTVTAMVEGFLPDDQVYVARTSADAPGVDGYLFLETAQTLMSGDFVRAKITDARDYDLIGVLEDECTE